MGERLDLGGVHLAIEVDRLGLLREHDGRVAEMARDQTCDADARRLDCEDLVYGRTCEQPGELCAHLVDQVDIDLVVEEAIDLQHAFRLDDAITLDAFFQKLHSVPFRALPNQ